MSPTALRALNYAPEIEAFKRAGARRRSVALGSLSDDFGAAYRRIFTREECDPGHGVELLGQSDMFATEPVGRWIRADGIRGIEDQRIKAGQLLFAGVGTLGETELYGRCILADKRLEGRIIGSDAVALTFKEPDSDVAAFAYAFLCTRAGVRAVRATGYGTKLMSLRMDFLRALPIPLGTDAQMTRVGVLIRTAVEQRETYMLHIREARTLLEQVPGYREARAMCEHRRARHIRWPGALPTFTAWTYASAGEALDFLGKKWSARLGDVLDENGVFNGPRFARIPCEVPYGIDFLSQRDVFLMRPVGRRIANPGFADRLLFVAPGTLLVGGHGTLGEGEIFGRVEIAAGALSRKAFTQDILRLIPKSGFESACAALLSSVVGFRLLRSTAVGTKILSLRPDLLRAIPFPVIDKGLGTLIDRAVTSALDARQCSEEAEAEAIRIVEQEVLPTWLA
ncbi:MAG: hypothetical protein EPO40_17645 [Myxococcaceae bacterium]|nr:MAG: hypothetical protein EPO40_17645 [Myxococcaceae bacterium]